MNKVINRIYSSLVDITYIRHNMTDCNSGKNLHISPTDNEACEQWCSSYTDCGGFVAVGSKCYFKNNTCKDNLMSNRDSCVHIH